MSAAEKNRLAQIEDRLKRARSSLEGLLPIWSQVDRKVKTLDSEIKALEDERLKIVQGQTAFAFDDLNF